MSKKKVPQRASGSIRKKKSTTARKVAKIVKQANAVLAASDAIRHPGKALTVKLPGSLYEMASRVSESTGVSIGTVVVLAVRRGSHNQETELTIAAAAIMSAREGLITPEEAAALGAGAK